MEERSCAVCSKEGRHVCSGCKTARYCSKEHQVVHWKEHKMNCKIYQVEYDEQPGDHLVASKDLKAGTIILKEDPLVIGPKQVDGPAICLGCCKNLNGRGVACPKCKWPMCGNSECWGPGSYHSLGECTYLKAGAVPSSMYALVTPKAVCQSILILRCFSLLKREPTKWEKLMKLKSDGPGRYVREVDYRDVFTFIGDWLPDDTVVPNECLYNWILKLIGITVVNNMKLFVFDDKIEQGLRGIYYVASNLAHSCVPNAVQTFTKEGQIVVRAAVPIAKGSKITINHVSVPLYGTIPRQIDLEKTRFVTCSCERCSDPTELGTFTSGIYCSKCPNQEGLLLPENPLVKLTEWICNKCSDRKTEAAIFEVMVDIEEDYGRLDKPFNRSVVGKCEAFIRKYEKMLHPNHYYLVGAKRYLCHTYGGSNPFDNTNNQVLRKKEAACKDVLKVLDVISPGLNRARADIHYHLYTVVETLGDKTFLASGLKLDADKFPAGEVKKLYKVLYESLKEAHTVYSWEPENTEGGRLYKIVDENLILYEFLVQGWKQAGFHL